MGVINPGGGGGGSSSLYIGQPITSSVLNSILFVGSGNDLQEDPANLIYDLSGQIFQAYVTNFLATGSLVTDANGLVGFNSYLSCGGNISVTVDNFAAGLGASSRISCGGYASGTSDNSGLPGAGGSAGLTLISCGGSSDVDQSCSSGAQGNGDNVFLASGGLNSAHNTFGFGGTVQICGVVDNSGSAGTSVSGTLNVLAGTTNLYGQVNFLGVVSASTFEVANLIIDNSVNFVDSFTFSNTPVPFVMYRVGASSGEYTAQFSLGGVELAVNVMNFGQIYGDYDLGYTYFAYPNQFGGVGGASNPVLTLTPASTGSVAGYLLNHVGINCVPTETDYDLQFGDSTIGVRKQRRDAGSGLDATDFLVSAGGAGPGQTNVGGGDLVLLSGVPTGNRSADVVIKTAVAGGSGSSDNFPAEIIRFASTGNTFKNKITTYNNILTVSNGIPSELATVDLTLQSAAKATTTIYTPVASGMFRISIALQVTRAATNSSALGGATGVVITYTEPDGSVAQTIVPLLTSQAGAVITPATGNVGNTTATQSQGSAVIYAKTGVAIQYAIGYTSVGVTTMQYSAHLKVEAM